LQPNYAAAHQLSLKSDDPQLRYSDETIFKMAAVCHLEFSKIAIFATCVCLSMVLLVHTKYRVNHSCRYSQNTIFNMAAVRHLEFHKKKFINQHVAVLEPKFESAHQRNRMITCRDIAIKPFSKWRPSAILNFQNLLFWSRELCLNVILLLHTKFRVNRTIKSQRYSQKTIFNMAAVRNFEFRIFLYFVIWPSLEPKSAAAHQISLKSDDPRLRYSDETILKMAAVRHLEFSKKVNLVP